MSRTRSFVICLVAVVIGSAQGAKLHTHVRLRQTFRHRLRGSQAQPDATAASRTLLTLDANHDGRVDPSEVAAFARSQDLDAETATKEFAGLDMNGDGLLDASELSAALDTDGGAEDAETPEPQQQQSVLQDTQAALVPAASLQSSAEGTVTAPAAPSQAATPQVQATDAPQESLDAFVASEGVVNTALEAGAEQPANTQQMPTHLSTELKSVSASTGTADADASAALPPATDVMAVETTESSRAQNSANTIVEQLRLQEHEEQEAQQLERSAAELSANSTALARSAIQQAMDLGGKAATEKTATLLKTLVDFQDKAKNAEVEAAVLRAKSQAELKQADELMLVANAALAGDRT